VKDFVVVDEYKINVLSFEITLTPKVPSEGFLFIKKHSKLPFFYSKEQNFLFFFFFAYLTVASCTRQLV